MQDYSPRVDGKRLLAGRLLSSGARPCASCAVPTFAATVTTTIHPHKNSSFWVNEAVDVEGESTFRWITGGRRRRNRNRRRRHHHRYSHRRCHDTSA